MFSDVNPVGHVSSGFTEPSLTQFPGPHLHLYEEEQTMLKVSQLLDAKLLV